MGRKLLVLVITGLLAVAAIPGVAGAGDGAAEDYGPGSDAIYLSLGTSLAAGTRADANGDSIPFSNRSYTDRLHRIMRNRVDHGIEHVKLGCPGETTDQFLGGVNLAGHPSFCAGSYASGSQVGDALATLATGDVVLVTIDIGANDIMQLQGACANDPTCILGGIPGIIGNVGAIMTALRSNGYTGPIVGMLYYNPQVAVAIGYYAGAPGPGPLGPVPGPDPALAYMTDALAVGFNAALAGVYGAFGSPVADTYAAFSSGDFGDDGGRFQKAGNGVFDNVDAVCTLTSMCPDVIGPKANIHPKPNGYRVMAVKFWKVVRALDLGLDD